MSLKDAKIGDILVKGKCERTIVSICGDIIFSKYENDTFIYSHPLHIVELTGWTIKNQPLSSCVFAEAKYSSCGHFSAQYCKTHLSFNCNYLRADKTCPICSAEKSLTLECGKVYDDQENERWLVIDLVLNDHPYGIYYYAIYLGAKDREKASCFEWGFRINGDPVVTTLRAKLVKLSTDQRPYRA